MFQENKYRSNVFLVELWPNDRGFYEISDVGLARESAQRRRKCFFDMPIGVTGHLDLQSGEIEIGEHTIVGAARIVEGKLSKVLGLMQNVWMWRNYFELERILV